MTLIHVPRPPQSALNPDRPINALLKAQIEHFHEAEKGLQHQTGICVSAIKTEKEAANYIRAVTEAILKPHAGAIAQRRRRGIEIAAVADEQVERRRATRRRSKKMSTAKTAGRRKN